MKSSLMIYAEGKGIKCEPSGLLSVPDGGVSESILIPGGTHEITFEGMGRFKTEQASFEYYFRRGIRYYFRNHIHRVSFDIKSKVMRRKIKHYGEHYLFTFQYD